MRLQLWCVPPLRLMILLLVCATSMAWGGTQLWDFENDADDWEVANGTWEAKGGIYQETSGADAAMHSLIGDENWDDYTVQARIRIDDGGQWAGIVFRAQSEFEYYVYYLNSTDNKSELWRHKQGGFDARDAISNNIAANGVAVVNDEWLDVKVVVEGELFQLFIDEELQAELTDAAYPAGKIGVWTWQSKGSFDDVMVIGDNVEDTLAVQPKGKLAVTWSNLKRSD